MKRLLLLPALIAAAVLAACTVPADISSPISAPGEVAYDERLIGTWNFAGEDAKDKSAKAILITIRPGGDGFLNAAFAMMSVTPGPEGKAAFYWVNRSAYASVIEGVTYFNTRSLDAGFISRSAPGKPLDIPGVGPVFHHPQRGFWIVRPEISDDGLLTLYVLSDKVPLKQKLSARELDCGEKCSIQVYDLSSRELIALIRSTDPEELFSLDFGPFARIEGSYPQ